MSARQGSPTPRSQGSHKKQLSSTSSNDSNDSTPGLSVPTARTANRKRLSFTALPPVVSNSGPDSGASSPSTQSSSTPANGFGPVSQSVALPDGGGGVASSNTPQKPFVGGRRGRSLSGTMDSPDNYLAQLAAKERRVVELKDEFTRIQQALKLAQDDLRRFRGQAPLALRSPHYNDIVPEAEEPQPVAGSRHGASGPSIGSPTVPSSAAGSGPRNDNLLEHRRARVGVGAGSTSANGAASGGSGQTFGRVVEELHTQFWGLFEDIKNVTMGEDSRTGEEHADGRELRELRRSRPDPSKRNSKDLGDRAARHSEDSETRPSSYTSTAPPTATSTTQPAPPPQPVQSTNSYYLI